MQTDQDLITLLEAGHPILTANKRLSRYLVQQFELHKMDSGCKAWRRPPVMPFKTWCRFQYDSLEKALPIISSSQGQLVWETIIDDSVKQTDHELLQLSSTARMAWKAEKLLIQHGTSFAVSTATEDQQIFLRWRQSWQHRLGHLGMIDDATLPLHVAEAVADGRLAPPEKVVFAGFDDFDPDVRYLQKKLAETGCDVVNFNPRFYAQVNVSRLSCQDREDEITRCALKIKNLLNLNPQAQIGIVAPRLDLYRDRIDRIFRAEFNPYDTMMANDNLTAFNISEAPSLQGESVVIAALKLLRTGNEIDIDDLGWLLRTPYILNAVSTRDHRAAVDRQVRQRRQKILPLRSIVKTLAMSGADNGLQTLFGHLLKFQSGRKKLLPGEWAEKFANLLSLVGWPGERGLSSREYQAVDRFRAILGELASLDMVSTAIGRDEAVSRLYRLIADTKFQPEGSDSHIHVVGMLEASGMEFDFLWILGMSTGDFPRKPQPNPFIPVTLQRERQMPHADAAREFNYAEKVFSRLLAAAPEVVASWPLTDEGMPLMMSGFLRGLAEAEPDGAPSSNPTLLVHDAAVHLETFVDNNAPPMVSREVVSGGTAIVKDQALCPFRAFGHHRLRAEAFESADIGIDAMTRGRLVHGVLEFFWQTVKSQTELLEMSPDEILQILRNAASSSITHDEKRERRDLPARIRSLETARLVRQALVWLDAERRRAPFQVAETEKAHTEIIGRLKFKTIIDRIDHLPNGRMAIIDYKTGDPDPAQWFDDRITEPQLPIYCQHIDPAQIDAVVFAVVRAGKKECRFKGIARSGSDWPGISDKSQEDLLSGRGWENFDRILENWRDVLPLLGDQFMDGHAMVDPADPIKSCQYCDLKPLCRIHEVSAWERRDAT